MILSLVGESYVVETISLHKTKFLIEFISACTLHRYLSSSQICNIFLSLALQAGLKRTMKLHLSFFWSLLCTYLSRFIPMEGAQPDRNLTNKLLNVTEE
jgi:hypothetical protein